MQTSGRKIKSKAAAGSKDISKFITGLHYSWAKATERKWA